MTTEQALDGARALRWNIFGNLAHPIPLNKDSAIFQFWCDNPYLESPLAPEIYTDDDSGNVYQAFLGGVVIYEPGQGCRVIH